jgi:hypothetical protein
MALADILNSVRHIDLEGLYNTFLGLHPRQQTIALVGCGVGLLLILVLPISIAAGKLGGLEEDIAKTQAQIDTAVEKIQQYAKRKKELDRLEQQFTSQSGDSPLTVIQRIASDMGIKAERPAEKGKEPLEFYEEEKVSFHLRGVDLEQVVNFLHKLETSTQRIMRAREVIIAPEYGNRSELKAELKEVAAYRLVAEGK